MPRFQWLLLAFCCFIPTIAFAEDDVAIDLRSPAPQVGLKFREVGRMEMKGLDLTMKSAGKILNTAKMDISAEEEKQYEVLAVEEGVVTKFKTRIVKDETNTKTQAPEGEPQRSEDLGDLAGQVVISEKIKKAWTHTLAEGEPTEKQKAALADLPPWEDNDGVPAAKQKIGDSWDMDATHIKKYVGESYTAMSGKVKVTLTGLKKVDGQLCAFMEIKGTIKGKLKAEGNEKVVTFGITATDSFSLKHGISLKSDGEFTIKATGKEKVDDMEIDVIMEGKAKFEQTAEVEK